MSSDSEQTGYTEEEISTIEAVLFSSPRPLPTNDLKKLLSSRHKGGVKGIRNTSKTAILFASAKSPADCNSI
jgi:hypothetical protein